MTDNYKDATELLESACSVRLRELGHWQGASLSLRN